MAFYNRPKTRRWESNMAEAYGQAKGSAGDLPILATALGEMAKAADLAQSIPTHVSGDKCILIRLHFTRDANHCPR